VDADQGRVLQYPHMGVKTKNRKASRTVLYDIPDLRAVVREWHAERLAEGPKALWYPAIGVGAKEEFIESRTDALRYGLKRLSALAGIPYMSPHKARHGHAVYGLKLARNMAEYKAVSQNLMHSTIGITDSIYAVLSDEDVREQIAGLGKGGVAPEAARVDEIVRLILSRVG
jgi:integrase